MSLSVLKARAKLIVPFPLQHLQVQLAWFRLAMNYVTIVNTHRMFDYHRVLNVRLTVEYLSGTLLPTHLSRVSH